jgi:hypothetical protein
MSDSIPPDPFVNLDTIINAIGEAGDDAEARRLYLRAALRQLEIVSGQTTARLATIVEHLTPPPSRVL